MWFYSITNASSAPTVQHYIPVKYLHFLCNVFIFSFQIILFRARSLPHISAIIICISCDWLLFTYIYIQATLFMLISLIPLCLSLTFLIVHHFALCIFLFSFVSIMYRAPYAEALQCRCILCTMTIKGNSIRNSIYKTLLITLTL